jgi:hypothetical protein
MPTPLPPDETVKKFVMCYNTRNYTCLHSLFSTNITNSHTLNGTEIKGKIIDYKIIKRNIKGDRRILTINITFVCDDKKISRVVEVPMKLERNYFRIDSWILEVLKCG